jgi:hypothetical protein
MIKLAYGLSTHMHLLSLGDSTRCRDLDDKHQNKNTVCPIKPKLAELQNGTEKACHPSIRPANTAFIEGG